MIVLITFAFLAGVVTVLSPCILPILPLILSSSLGGESIGKARPFGVIIGFVASFTVFTLFLSAVVSFTGISADALRLVSVVVIALFGVSFLIPQFQVFLEKLFSRLTGFVPKQSKQKGFGSGLLMGFSLGLLWTPCVGPILASVISLALTGSVTWAAFLITLAYALGTALPMLLIMWGGRELLNRVPWLLSNTGNIQKGFGVIMILVALAIYTNLDRKFQTYIVTTFPEYGAGLTKLEDKPFIREELDGLNKEVDSKNTKQLLPSSFSARGTPAPEITAGGVWINSEPLSLTALRGKVVLIDFWTYSCINCQRTLPYLKEWHKKYAHQGLVIIGVHAPEFEFEKNEKNVRKAVEDFGLEYPIVQDNNFTTWQAYQNHYWPAKYFIDKDGLVRYTHFGEGKYDESEAVIQQLLKEAGAEKVSQTVENLTYQTYAKTPETYLGYGRLGSFASFEPVQPNVAAGYTAPQSIPRNNVAYQGQWTVMEEYAHPEKDASLFLNFDAREVYLVMRATSGKATVKVLVDGLLQSTGDDVVNGTVEVNDDRLYRLVRLPQAGRHVLELQFLDNECEVYAFTFG